MRLLSIAADEAVPEAVLAEALSWLTRRARSNLATEILLRRSRGVGCALVVAWEKSAELCGVAVGTSAFCSLEAPSSDVASKLWSELVIHFMPEKVVASGAAQVWIRDHLLANSSLLREHELLVMRTRRMAEAGAGRYATAADLPVLERYERDYAAERDTSIGKDWPSLVERRQVAVLDVDGTVASVLLRSGETPSVACIGGTWTFPEFRRRGLARQLTAFLVAELLGEVVAVQLIVDDDNLAAIGLYEALGFESAGAAWFGYPGR